jgi:uncharacterized protein YkwD
MRRLMMLMSLIALAGGLQARAEVPSSARPAAVQQRILQLVNEARAKGRRSGREYFAPAVALVSSEKLTRAAKSHAQDMAKRGYFEHQSPDGSEPKDRVRRTGYQYRLTGENIAFGPESAEEVVAGWLASPGHCANIMDSRFRDFGVAVATGRKRGHIYWVQEFGLPAR